MTKEQIISLQLQIDAAQDDIYRANAKMRQILKMIKNDFGYFLYLEDIAPESKNADRFTETLRVAHYEICKKEAKNDL